MDTPQMVFIVDNMEKRKRYKRTREGEGENQRNRGVVEKNVYNIYMQDKLFKPLFSENLGKQFFSFLFTAILPKLFKPLF